MFLFSKKIIGLDISDKTIEVVLLDSRGKKVIAKNRKKISDGLVKKGDILNKELLKKEIIDLLKESKPDSITEKEIVLIVPESKIFIKNLIINKELDLESKLEEEVSKNFPIKKDNLIYSSKIIGQNKNKIKVLIVATYVDLLKKWQSFLEEIGLESVAFYPEQLASFRGIFNNKNQKPVCLVDMGSNSTSVSFYDRLGLYYSFFSPISGNYIDQKIAEKIQISFEEAEEKKMEVNLDNKKNLTSTVVINLLDNLISEINQTFDYLKDEKIEKIILIGGLSQMNGLRGYFQQKIDAKIEIGQSNNFDSNIPLEYISASGAALFGINKKYQKKDPYFKPFK